MPGTTRTNESGERHAAGTLAADGRGLTLAIPWTTWAALLIGVVAVVAIRTLVHQAQQPIGWALAAVVLAALAEPVVRVLDGRLPRVLAIIATIILFAAVVGGIAWLTLRDLDAQAEKLRQAIPEAARSLERSQRFGDAAREFQLVERAGDLAERLPLPSGEAGSGAQGRIGGAFVTVILSLFFLGWGQRLTSAAFGEIADPAVRTRARSVVVRAFRSAQRYAATVMGAAVVVFVLTLGLLSALDVPGAAPLALFVAAWSTIPVIGLGLALLLTAILVGTTNTFWWGIAVAVLAIVGQVVYQQLVDRATRRCVGRPGAAVMLISMVLGYELYGVGGALILVAFAIFVSAVLDAMGDVDELPETAPG